MYSNGTLTIDAQCGYALRVQGWGARPYAGLSLLKV